MKGKSTFKESEANQIISLIEQKLKADASTQKGIRNKIRNLGFYATDFGVGNGYTVADFKRVVTIKGGTSSKPSIAISNKEAPVKTPTPKKSTIVESDVEQDFSTVFNADTINELKKRGFKGFVPIKDIINDYSILPKQKGVYILLHSGSNAQYLEIGSGGHFKDKNPNVHLDIIKENWVSDSPVIYIGKAGSESGSATLQSRLKQYFNFGQGKAVGHWGGRYVWQLKNPYDIIVGWLETPNDDPRTIEAAMIRDFIKKYGKRPFANLVG